MDARMMFASLVALAAIGGAAAQAKSATLSYFGRSSVKIKTPEGFVIYIDPYAPGDYSEPADLVLVTHGHSDHNKISLVKLKPGTVIAAPKYAVSAKEYRETKEGDVFSVGAVSVHAVPAYNKNHDRASNVGYVITMGQTKLYHAGDTSFIPEMAELATLNVDYALLPVDGFYNMDGAEAMKCVDAIKPRFAIAIHSSPSGAYDAKKASALKGPKVKSLPAGATITLE